MDRKFHRDNLVEQTHRLNVSLTPGRGSGTVPIERLKSRCLAELTPFKPHVDWTKHPLAELVVALHRGTINLIDIFFEIKSATGLTLLA